MNRLKLIIPLFGLLCLANIAGASAATIDPYKGRWRVDIVRTLENLLEVAPKAFPEGGIPAVLIKSMRKMSLEISRKRYVFRSGSRKIINSRFEIISLSDEGVRLRIYIKNQIREQMLSLSPEGELQVVALFEGRPEARAFANYFFWRRIARKKTAIKSAKSTSETSKAKK